MTETGQDRRRAAAVLRELRADAALSTTQLAGRLGWSQSKVSKTELGRTTPSPEDVDAWARATGASSATREELRDLAERAATRLTAWRRELAPGRRRMQQDIQRFEAAASVVRVFSPDVVVGLAQTPAYAAAMFRLGRDADLIEDVEKVVSARLARQAVLDDEGKKFLFVMGETALWRRLISPEQMSTQIQQLRHLTTRPNVDLAIIRFGGQEHTHQYHGFAVLGDPDADDEALVLAETVTRGLTIRGTDEVRQYIEHFTALRAGAVDGGELDRFLQEVSARWARS
ncbi:MAG: helix-turn-helix domain-containing protein [Pseudonocardiaceae bacterium]